MRILAVMTILAVNLGALWQQATRETNSQAATRRGLQLYEQKKYAEAARAFSAAQKIRSTPAAAFNAGTAEMASGARDTASSRLTAAASDPKIRPDALYNRGTGALTSKAYEDAIRDLKETLRQRPSDPQAKRNLEIALTRQEQQQRSRGGEGQQGDQGQQQKQRQEPSPREGRRDGEEQNPQADIDALLRSVQQQEREELMRMRRGRPESRRVGW